MAALRAAVFSAIREKPEGWAFFAPPPPPVRVLSQLGIGASIDMPVAFTTVEFPVVRHECEMSSCSKCDMSRPLFVRSC